VAIEGKILGVAGGKVPLRGEGNKEKRIFGQETIGGEREKNFCREAQSVVASFH